MKSNHIISSSSSSDTDEETIEDLPQISSVVKHGKTFNNIIPVNASEKINVKNWILVSFEPDNNYKPSCNKNSSFMYYIGQIMENKNKTIFVETFLRSKTPGKNQKTIRDHKGMVYGFPEIRDICEFSTSQVVGKLEKPIPYGRGLFKFKYDCKSSS